MNPINIFDFDGTLTTETWPKFWVWVSKFGYNGEIRNNHLENALEEYRKTHPGNQLETFFGFFNDLLVNNNESISYEELLKGEEYIQYNPGVKQILKRSLVKNYIISGGLKEFLQRLKIALYFDGIYGTPVIENKNGRITGIGNVMTDEKKIDAIRAILVENNRLGEECHNVYYVGDGYSDAAAFEYVHNHGGIAIFVTQPNQEDAFYSYNNQIYEKLNKKGIIDFYCLADYREESELSKLLNREKDLSLKHLR